MADPMPRSSSLDTQLRRFPTTVPANNRRHDETQVLASRISINQMTTLRWSFEDDLINMVKFPECGLGLWRKKYEDYGEERAIEFIQELQMRISSISWIGGFLGTHGYLLQDALSEAEDVIRFASQVNCSSVLVATGPQGTHIRPHAKRLVSNALLHLADYAAEHNVTLLLQPMHHSVAQDWTFLRKIEECLELLRHCDHPALKLCLHTFHSGLEKELSSRLPGMIPMLGLVRLCDGKKIHKSYRPCLPGQGQLDLKSMIRTLEHNGYHGQYELDIWNDQTWRSDYDQVIHQYRFCCLHYLRSAHQTIQAT